MLSEDVLGLEPADLGIGRLFWRIHEGVIVTEAASSRIVLWNPAAETIFGYSAAEIRGRPLDVLIPEPLQARLRAELAGSCKLGSAPTGDRDVVLDLPALRKTGEEIAVEVRLCPVDDAPVKQRLVLALVRDITERQRAEAERAQLIREQAARAEAEASRQRLAFLAEASRVLALSLEYEATLQRVAQLAVPALADWCVIDIVNDDQSIRRLVVARLNPSEEEVIHELESRYPLALSSEHPRAQVLRTGTSVLISDVTDAHLQAVAQDAEHLRLLRRLGVKSFLVVPLLVRGQILGALAFGSAQPERRYTSGDLTLAEDLARRAALAIDNARLYEEAQAAIRTRNEFLSLVSHDLKNPLATIKARAQVMQRWIAQLETPMAGRILDGLKNIDATANKMTALIGELVDITRLQVGHPLTLYCRPTDLVALAHHVAEEHQKNTEDHHLRVEAAIPELIGDWDPDRLERVVANLVGNAIKYSPAGGEITLRVSRVDEEAGARAVLSVQDQGIGIPAADLPGIFNRFQRAGNVVGRIAGSGIGLASVRQIIEQHGGTIDVVSQEKGGSTFTVRLPLNE